MPGLEFDLAGIAVVAIARLKRDGTVVYAKNCLAVRTGVGVYEITLDDGEGVVDAETFILATLLQSGIPQPPIIESEIEALSHPTDPRKKYILTLDSDGNPADRGWNAVFGRTIT